MGEGGGQGDYKGSAGGLQEGGHTNPTHAQGTGGRFMAFISDCSHVRCNLTIRGNWVKDVRDLFNLSFRLPMNL